MSERQRWQRVAEIFEAAVDVPFAERARFVAAAAGQDAQLYRQVMRLLVADDRTSGVVDAPAVAFAREPSRQETRFGPYRMIECIGEGGSSVVYLGERADDAYHQQVAIKVLRRGFGSSLQVERFHRERQILARLEHPGIARLIDGGTTASQTPYLVMELVEGRPIHRYCEEEGLDLEARLHLFRKVLAAVSYAHRRLVVHRDLKPANVLVRDGEPKLLDFGIAKLIRAESDDDRLTTEGMLLFSPSAVSPEQILGQPVTTATDVYALGILLYRLLAGQPPYRERASDLEDLFERVCQTDPEPPSTQPSPWQRRLSGDLDAIVLKAMARASEDRYPSADALAEDVENYLTTRPVKARSAGPLYRLGKLILRHRWRFAAAMMLVALVATVSLQAVLQTERAEQALVMAENERDKAEGINTFLLELLNTADPESGERRELTVREAIYRAEELIPEHFENHPHIEAAVRHRVGVIFMSLRDLDAATKMLRRAADLRAAAQEDDPTPLAETLIQLSRALRGDGRLAAAEAVVREAHDLAARHLEPSSFVALQALSTLAGLHRDRNELAAAEGLFRQQVEQSRASPDRRQLGVAMVNLGATLIDREIWQQGITTLAEARRVLAQTRGERHPSVAVTLNHLTRAHIGIGAYGQAELLARQALDIQQEAYGDGHPRVASVLLALAEIERLRGDLAAAERSSERALAIYEKNLGDRHRDVAISLTSLASISLQQGELEVAEARVERALQILRPLLGDEHRFTQAALDVGARLWRAQGRIAAAEQQWRDNLLILRSVVGENSRSAALVRGHLADSLRHRGQCDAAEPLYARAVTDLREAGIVGRDRIELELGRIACMAARPEHIEEARQALRELSRTVAESLRQLPDLAVRIIELINDPRVGL